DILPGTAARPERAAGPADQAARHRGAEPVQPGRAPVWRSEPLRQASRGRMPVAFDKAIVYLTNPRPKAIISALGNGGFGMPYFNSTAISRAEYDSGTLRIWFVESGGPYDFYNVPLHIFEGLCNAVSK